ncbi:MAG: hypothetical protein PHC92_08260 [Syntrophomonadaceae bacterium]|nr:hypothetical protein [Syntrophomonadaceae bacterium]
MEIIVRTGAIAPIHSAGFSLKSYKPKKKNSGTTAKADAAQSSFFMVLSELVKSSDTHLQKKPSVND